ncbi:MAG: double-strand break repair protein AddB [Pseudomonadota bacterium]
MTTPRLFAVPLGAPYPAAFVDGFLDRFAIADPAQVARATIIVNSGSMARAIKAAFAHRGPLLLPKIIPVGAVEQLIPGHDIPPAIDPIRLRLELAQLTAKRIEADPNLAAGSTAFDISGALLRLLGEMASEGVAPGDLAALDMGDHSEHWQRNLKFISLVEAFLQSGTTLESEARQRKIVDALISAWQITPPSAPVVVAGSTGSRGTTRRLIEAVARLSQGYVVLPGLDATLAPGLWAELGEDHPQQRFVAIMSALTMGAGDLEHWAGNPAAPDRQKVLSLALRPPPVTDQWVREGPNLPPLADALSGVTLIEAPNQQAEAQAIALGLRAAVEDGKRAALVSPDRMLTRRVSAALDRWGIVADDSAGRPLALSAPGRLLRQISSLNRRDMPTSEVLALLKHPLIATGAPAARGAHLLMTRELEIWARRKGHGFLPGPILGEWTQGSDDRLAWLTWLNRALPAPLAGTPQPLAETLEDTVRAAEALAAGPGHVGSGALWDEDAGKLAYQKVETLRAVADAAGPVTPRDFNAVLPHILQDEVRSALLPHEDVQILGTLEARNLSADVVILAGLNEQIWPPAEDQDPWLNRALRRRAGLLSPERRTGLSAHDFEQAFGAGEIWLSRTLRSDDGEHVPSRWLNRLQNLVTGLPARGGDTAWDAAKARGQVWIDLAQQIDRRLPIAAPAPRPAPAPPALVRPTRLSVTEIQRLIRDPFEIYAKHVLKLAAIPQPPAEPDARLRGIALHEVADRFTATPLSGDRQADTARLMATAAEVFDQMVPWPVTRHLWLARLEKIAADFLNDEARRQAEGHILIREEKAELTFGAPPFTLVGKVDRIDRLAGGQVAIYDYKSGSLPTPKQMQHYDRQLLLEAMMVARGAFGEAMTPQKVGYIGLGSDKAKAPLILGAESTGWAEIETVSKDFAQLLAAYRNSALGYTSRRIIEKKEYRGDYDHLARYGEWDEADGPETERVGQ